MKVLLIGRQNQNNSNGPEAVVASLNKEFLQRNDIEYIPFLYNRESTSLNSLRRLITAILTNKNIIVNVHSSGLLIPFLVMILSKFSRTNRYYLTLHGLHTIESKLNGSYKKIYACIEELLIRHFDNIIVVSEMMKKNLEDMYNRVKNVYIIPNGCEVFDAETDVVDYENKLQILSLGGLKKRKGILETIKVFSILYYKYHLNFVLSIYGPEENEYTKEWLNDYLKQNNISNEIIEYKGMIKDKRDVCTHIARSHFQIALSKYDTFNIAIAESLAIGCPVIASSLCGASYLISSPTEGLVVDLDSDNITETIYKYIKKYSNIVSNEEKRAIAQKNRKALSWRNVVDEYINLFSIDTKQH